VTPQPVAATAIETFAWPEFSRPDPMYLAFYGLRERPFNATPDPRFLYLTPGHREALAQLVYSVQENRGFLVLTGEVGTGKTTLLKTFVQRLNGKAAIAYVFTSTLAFEGLLEYVLEELKVPAAGSTVTQRLLALRRFMIDRHRARQKTVLILDEAQNLEMATLEEIRMLSNFETPTEKLLQILLVGQPELRAKLERPESRPVFAWRALVNRGSSAIGRTTVLLHTRAESRDASTSFATIVSSSATPTSDGGSTSTS
jgi:type II secretory pathway predicted ATPase ExeA